MNEREAFEQWYENEYNKKYSDALHVEGYGVHASGAYSGWQAALIYARVMGDTSTRKDEEAIMDSNSIVTSPTISEAIYTLEPIADADWHGKWRIQNAIRLLKQFMGEPQGDEGKRNECDCLRRPDSEGIPASKNLTSSTNLMEATGLMTTSGKTKGQATREDAFPVASTNKPSEFVSIKESEIYIRGFNDGCRHKEAQYRYVLENEKSVARFETKSTVKAQHRQKVAELTEKFMLTGNETMAKLINKHFGEEG